ncbi:transcriptional regulator [Flavobacteriaceae bacterium R38]|nr:transcriptional regulator [Flavobacteriaceae bacterium R38]
MGVIRQTKSVKALLDEFQEGSGAISAIDLIKRLDKKLNKTTVYRVLDKLEDDGILHSFLGKNGIKWYAKCNGCSKTEHIDFHPHFECLICGRVDCLLIEISIPKIPNRKVEASQILIQGKCEACHNSIV